MSCYITNVMLCYITCYITCHVISYNMCITCYITCHVILYNMCHVMLYNKICYVMTSKLYFISMCHVTL